MNRPEREKLGFVWVNPRKLNAPQEVIDVQLWWKQKAEAYGDKGSCVIGAGFEFKYEGEHYFMPPVSGWQGSGSWEHCKDEVQEKLEAIGAQDIRYHWGLID
ncbi:hypothetical protein [Paenibacillus naphthalenovorans]|uniref:hypothetical protein n=1 Tax=Paenibacillus naphthalenovorans TaxID=162209 RepID=UPI003D2BECF4